MTITVNATARNTALNAAYGIHIHSCVTVFSFLLFLSSWSVTLKALPGCSPQDSRAVRSGSGRAVRAVDAPH